MDIKRVETDHLTQTITLNVPEMEYKGQVEKRLNEQAATASIKGFRKGQVPKSLVDKQFRIPIKIEEVNKVVQMALSRYLQDNKIEYLGSPLPKQNPNFSWEATDLVFEFEIGTVPDFKLEIDTLKNIPTYDIKADDTFLNAQVARLQKQYGKIASQEVVEEGNDVSGTFSNEEFKISNRTTLDIEDFADKNTAKLFIGKKIGDIITLKTKGLFADDHKLIDYMQVPHDLVHSLDTEVTFKIDEVVASIPADLNQEFFDKLFGDDQVHNLDEMKAKIREDVEKQFQSQADQKYMMDAQDYLIENTKFDLPATFLKKWLLVAGEKPLTPAEAEDELLRSEKGLRYQLIQGKIMADNNVQITFDDLKNFTANAIRQQMAQYGKFDSTDEEVNEIVARVMQNQEEVKRLTDQVVGQKMFELYKQKANQSPKQVTYDQFMQTMYGH